eukprot:2054577-Prymnesium_polylepis.1
MGSLYEDASFADAFPDKGNAAVGGTDDSETSLRTKLVFLLSNKHVHRFIQAALHPDKLDEAPDAIKKTAEATRKLLDL